MKSLFVYTNHTIQLQFGCFLFTCLLFLVPDADAQLVPGHRMEEDTAFSRIYRTYMGTVGGTAAIYNGPEYTGSYPLTTGTPFFDTSDFQRAVISYGGVTYKDILLAYDLVSNEIAIKGYQGLSIRLDPNKVDYFLLRGHHFVRAESTVGNGSVDFYDLLYDGPVILYAKRSKQVERAFNPADPYFFRPYNYYFLQKESQTCPIEGKKDLLKLFKNRSSDIKAFWKKNKTDFKKQTEQAIVTTVAYYAQLTR